MKSEKIEIVFYKDNKGVKLPLQSKSEAIEKMAKAIEENASSGSFNSLAEAALNSLLEDNK